MPQIIINDSLEELHATVAEQIADEALEAVTGGRKFSMVLSGGSTPRGIFERLAEEEMLERLPWEKMHFFWGDERHVPPNHPESNYRMAWEAMLAKVPVPPENVHRIQAELPDPVQAAQMYQDELVHFFQLNSGAWPRFDLVLLGMGPDGHTASLFPGTNALHTSDQIVMANWVGKFDSWRITMTAPAINHAAHVIVLVAGGAKAPALRAALQGPKEPEQLPIQLIDPTDGSLVWVLDRAAAVYLK